MNFKTRVTPRPKKHVRSYFFLTLAQILLAIIMLTSCKDEEAEVVEPADTTAVMSPDTAVKTPNTDTVVSNARPDQIDANDEKILMNIVPPSDTVGIAWKTHRHLSIGPTGSLNRIALQKPAGDTSTIIMSGDGNVDLFCGRCQAILVDDFVKVKIPRETIIKCNRCKTVNRYTY